MVTERPRGQADPPIYETEVRWDLCVPARDGIELSANLWLPLPRPEAPRGPWPVILEMIPYGKDNWRRNADTARGEWLAARGFALCRLDVRGTGASGGIAMDEYTEAETQDGYDAVEWLAAQPWCNGRVGMWGISYGGFTAIQVAKLRPPHLRAILPMYATDDRYRDDVHIRGGCVTASEKSQYAVSQLGMNALPPPPSFRGAGWREAWHARLAATPPWLFPWIREQVDGPYWRRGSLAPDYDAIGCAVFLVGGWNDSYVDPVFRMQERCGNAERRSIVGNWVHSFPDDAYPGPNIDWYHELLRFFGRHLRGDETGWANEAAITWFERTYAAPEAFPVTWPGRWRAAAAVPVPGVVEHAWRLGVRSLVGAATGATDADAGERADADAGADVDAVDVLPYRATVGTSGPLSWGAGWPPNGLARDLRPDEARGLTYTSEPLVAPMSVIGIPEAILHLEATMAVATCHVRVSEVAPDGTSFLVSAGVLNLTHRRSDTSPEPMCPGEVAEVRIPLRATGYRFTPGHRIRLTVLASAWPMLWPSPLPGELRVHRGPAAPSRLLLPVLPDTAPTLPPPAFRADPVVMRAVGSSTEDEPVWRIEEDVLGGRVTVTIEDGGESVQEDGSRLYSGERLVLSVADADPAHARLDTRVVYRWAVDGARIEIGADGAIASDDASFDVRVALDVQVDGEPFFAREWAERIPRNLV